MGLVSVYWTLWLPTALTVFTDRLHWWAFWFVFRHSPCLWCLSEHSFVSLSFSCVTNQQVNVPSTTSTAQFELTASVFSVWVNSTQVDWRNIGSLQFSDINKFWSHWNLPSTDRFFSALPCAEQLNADRCWFFFDEGGLFQLEIPTLGWTQWTARYPLWGIVDCVLSRRFWINNIPDDCISFCYRVNSERSNNNPVSTTVRHGDTTTTMDDTEEKMSRNISFSVWRVKISIYGFGW